MEKVIITDMNNRINQKWKRWRKKCIRKDDKLMH